MQHTHMPAYCIRHLGVWRWNRVTYGRRTRRTYLRLLHLVLGVHLCDDLVHVGLQDHPSHHHLCQDVVDLRNAGHFKVREQVFLFNKGKSDVIELITVLSIYIYIYTDS